MFEDAVGIRLIVGFHVDLVDANASVSSTTARPFVVVQWRKSSCNGNDVFEADKLNLQLDNSKLAITQ